MRPGQRTFVSNIDVLPQSWSTQRVPPDGSSGSQKHPMTTFHSRLPRILSVLPKAWIALFLSVTALVAAPGDEHWDTQFGWPGVTDTVLGLRHHAGKLYAGGLYAPPGGVTN